jgi:hypothetical protein
MNFKFIYILLLNFSLNFSTTTTKSNDYALNYDEIISQVKNAESASTSTTTDFKEAQDNNSKNSKSKSIFTLICKTKFKSDFLNIMKI